MPAFLAVKKSEKGPPPLVNKKSNPLNTAPKIPIISINLTENVIATIKVITASIHKVRKNSKLFFLFIILQLPLLKFSIMKIYINIPD